MKDLSSQFKGLDPKDAGSWPPLPKLFLLAFLFFSILAVTYVFDTDSMHGELNAARDKEATLKSEYLEKKRIAVNIDLYRKRLKDIDTSFGELLRQLPDKSQVDRLVIDINQAGINRGLQFDLFRPALAEEKKDFYAELPITITVNGGYHQLGEFSADIAQLARIVTLNDLSINAGKDGVLQMNATAKTFRYLSDAEIAEQKKIAAAKKAGTVQAKPAADQGAK